MAKKLTHLSKECVHMIFSYLGFCDGYQLQETCKLTHEYLNDDNYWQDFLVHRFSEEFKCSYKMKIEASLELIRQVWNSFDIQTFHHLENDILATSSIDRAVESPRNVLYESTCHNLLNSDRFRNLDSLDEPERLSVCYHIQRHCGCAGPSSCYWSSKPSPNADKIEYMTVQLTTPVACVVGFSLTSYQAFFHPNAPIYGAREASIQFLHPDTIDCSEGMRYLGYQFKNKLNEKRRRPQTKLSNTPEPYKIIPATTEAELQEGVIYQSDFFPLENTFQSQTVFLPKPVLCIGGVVRIVLRGFHMRQVVTDEPVGNEDFYMCLSNLNIIGVPLGDYAVEDNASSSVKSETASTSAATTPVASVFINTNQVRRNVPSSSSFDAISSTHDTKKSGNESSSGSSDINSGNNRSVMDGGNDGVVRVVVDRRQGERFRYTLDHPHGYPNVMKAFMQKHNSSRSNSCGGSTMNSGCGDTTGKNAVERRTHRQKSKHAIESTKVTSTELSQIDAEFCNRIQRIAVIYRFLRFCHGHRRLLVHALWTLLACAVWWICFGKSRWR